MIIGTADFLLMKGIGDMFAIYYGYWWHAMSCPNTLEVSSHDFCDKFISIPTYFISFIGDCIWYFRITRDMKLRVNCIWSCAFPSITTKNHVNFIWNPYEQLVMLNFVWSLFVSYELQSIKKSFQIIPVSYEFKQRLGSFHITDTNRPWYIRYASYIPLNHAINVHAGIALEYIDWRWTYGYFFPTTPWTSSSI